MQGIIHNIAYHYHWSKSDIEDGLSLDEAFYYTDAIKRSKITDDLAAMTIACVPQMDDRNRKNIVRDLELQLRKLQRIYNIDVDDDSEPEAGAFDRIRQLLNKKNGTKHRSSNSKV